MGARRLALAWRVGRPAGVALMKRTLRIALSAALTALAVFVIVAIVCFLLYPCAWMQGGRC